MYRYFIPFYSQMRFHCMTIAPFVCLLFSWWKFDLCPLLWFYYNLIFSILNNAAVSICIQVFVHIYVFISLGYILGMRLLCPCNNSVFKGLRKCKLFSKAAVPVYVAAALHERVPAFLLPHQHLLLPVCLIIAILVGWSGISWFWFAYFWWLMMLNIYLFIGHLYFFFLEEVATNALFIFKFGYCLFIASLRIL